LIIRALAVRSSGLSFFLLVACSGGSKKAGDSVALSASPPAAVTASKPAIDPCPKNGLWAPCSVERRLKQSGFVVTRLDTAARNHAGFTVKPVVLSLGKSKLEVFLYESDADANRDASALDTVAVAPKGQAGAWELPPILIRNANLIAVLLTENARQAERASAALTAGPPQKGSSR
jgi:hypothetical protein